MTTAVINETDRSGVRTQVVDAARRVAHLSHEARLVKSLATDAVEDAVHATNQTIKTAIASARAVQVLALRCRSNKWLIVDSARTVDQAGTLRCLPAVSHRVVAPYEPRDD